MKKTGSHDQSETSIVSDDNVENHSSDECESEESSEEDESSGDDWSFENKTLGNHIALSSDIKKDHCRYGQDQYECFIPGSILIMLYEDICVKYVKCITVVSHVHLLGVEMFGPIQA